MNQKYIVADDEGRPDEQHWVCGRCGCFSVFVRTWAFMDGMGWQMMEDGGKIAPICWNCVNRISAWRSLEPKMPVTVGNAPAVELGA